MSGTGWCAFSRGGALAHWLLGPLMAVTGIVSGMPVLVILGVASFAVGVFILWSLEGGDASGND